jgi:hypothetical protein
MCFGSVRRRQQEDSFGGMIHPAELHVLTSSQQRRNGIPVAHCLTKGGQVGVNLVQLLGAAQCPAEPGDHLIQDEQGTVLVT